MKRFDKFGDYMFDLLPAPLKKGARAVNQFLIFFRVVGREFDRIKEDAFRVREEANVATASPAMLPVHGQDRDMPRLSGEDVEAYRTRLYMKGLISEWGGTKTGILYALTALGYDQSYIEPFSEQDPERWAEFIIFLKGSEQSGVNNLRVIDAEVMKIKEGSSLPAYGADAGNVLAIGSACPSGLSWYPRCNEIRCGVFPHRTAVGYQYGTILRASSHSGAGAVDIPEVGTVAASKKFYQLHAYAMYQGFASKVGLTPDVADGLKEYLRCSEETFHVEQVEREGES